MDKIRTPNPCRRYIAAAREIRDPQFPSRPTGEIGHISKVIVLDMPFRYTYLDNEVNPLNDLIVSRVGQQAWSNAADLAESLAYSNPRG